MDRLVRISAALEGLRARFAEKNGLITALRQQAEEREGIISRLQARLSRPNWAELDSGESISVGYECRYMLRDYACHTAHTKALTRRPTNTSYWAEITD